MPWRLARNAGQLHQANRSHALHDASIRNLLPVIHSQQWDTPLRIPGRSAGISPGSESRRASRTFVRGGPKPILVRISQTIKLTAFGPTMESGRNPKDPS